MLVNKFKFMSLIAKKSLNNPIGLLFAASVLLVGCQGGGDAAEKQNISQQSDVTGESAGDSDGTQREPRDLAILTWDAPATRENGESLKVGEIDYYVLSWGQDPDTLAHNSQIDCVNCTDMKHVIDNLDQGTWYFTVQTRDTDGNLSRKADLASKNI